MRRVHLKITLLFTGKGKKEEKEGRERKGKEEGKRGKKEKQKKNTSHTYIVDFYC